MGFPPLIRAEGGKSREVNRFFPGKVPSSSSILPSTLADRLILYVEAGSDASKQRVPIEL